MPVAIDLLEEARRRLLDEEAAKRCARSRRQEGAGEEERQHAPGAEQLDRALDEAGRQIRRPGRGGEARSEVAAIGVAPGRCPRTDPRWIGHDQIEARAPLVETRVSERVPVEKVQRVGGGGSPNESSRGLEFVSLDLDSDDLPHPSLDEGAEESASPAGRLQGKEGRRGARVRRQGGRNELSRQGGRGVERPKPFLNRGLRGTGGGDMGRHDGVYIGRPRTLLADNTEDVLDGPQIFAERGVCKE